MGSSGSSQAGNGRLGVACLACGRLSAGSVYLAVVGRAARGCRARCAGSISDLGCAAAGATCRRGSNMGLLAVCATAWLGSCTFVGRARRSAACVPPRR